MINTLDLAGDVGFCSETGPLTLTVPISTKVYKCVPANLMLGWGNLVLDWHPIQGRNTPHALCYGKWRIKLTGFCYVGGGGGAHVSIPVDE